MDEADARGLTADDDLLLTGLVDSLGVMRLVAYIEDTFAVSVHPGDVTIENFRTIADMTRYIQEQQVSAPTPRQ